MMSFGILITDYETIQSPSQSPRCFVQRLTKRIAVSGNEIENYLQ